MLRTVIGCIALAVTATASAGFSIEGSPAVSSERGPMGNFQPYQQDARAAFRGSDADLKPRQAKYQEAELVVDLAYKPVTQKGSGHANQVDGFADDVPFPTAMKMILPTGWQLYKDKGLDQDDVPEQISYLGGRAWPEVLGQIGDRYALQFHVDWYDRTVVMAKGRQSATQQASRIRVIAEPASSKPVGTAAAKSSVPPSGSAQAFAAKPTPVLQGASVASSSSAAGASGLPRPVLKAGAAQSSTPQKSAVASTPAKAAPVTKPVDPPKPIGFSMQVRAGTLHDNERLAAMIPKPRLTAPTAPVLPTWSVSAADETYRQALRKWSEAASWVFEPEHWAVPVDIPITASASFRGDFRTAVQKFISTTELSETPLQPCFYSNKVVRIVPYNEMCDRMSVR